MSYILINVATNEPVTLPFSIETAGGHLVKITRVHAPCENYKYGEVTVILGRRTFRQPAQMFNFRVKAI